MSPVALAAIAVAAVLGSVIGSFFRIRLAALVWAAPIVALLVGGLMFAAPHLPSDEAAPPAALIARQLADPALLAEMLVAFAVGAAASTVMVRYARTQARATPAPRLKDVAAQRALARGDEPATQAEGFTRRRLGEFAPLPVYEVTPTAGFTPAPESTKPPELRTGAERRRQTRRRSALAGRVLLGEGRSSPCGIQNLSVGGARVKLNAPLPLPHQVCLLDLTHWLAHDAEVRWQDGETAGVRFTASHDLRNPHTERERELHHLCADLAPR